MQDFNFYLDDIQEIKRPFVILSLQSVVDINIIIENLHYNRSDDTHVISIALELL